MRSVADQERIPNAVEWPKVYRLLDPRSAPTCFIWRCVRGFLTKHGAYDLNSYDIIDGKDNALVLKIVDLYKRESLILDPDGTLVLRSEWMRTTPTEDTPPFGYWTSWDAKNDRWPAACLLDRCGNVVGAFKGHCDSHFRVGPHVSLTLDSRQYILRKPSMLGKSRRRCMVLADDVEVGFMIPWNHVPEIHLADHCHLVGAACLLLAEKKYDIMDSGGA